MLRRMPNGLERRLTVVLLLLALGFVAGCGGGGSPSQHVQAPLVRGFSPFLSPLDFITLQQNPTFTNGTLTNSTDTSYPGKIVIFFQADTILDPRSAFVGGDASLGLDLSALQVLQFIPGTGNVELPLSVVEVLADRIICTPASLPLPDGQYSIGVFDNVRNIDGVGLVEGPVFHAFTVGSSDAVEPFVVTTSPAPGAIGVGAGVPAPQVPAGPTADVADVRTEIFGPSTPDTLIRFNEGIDAARVNALNMSLVNAGNTTGGAPPIIPPATGFPRLKSEEDKATLPSNGHEILWRADRLGGGFPFGTIIEGTVVGLYNDEASAAADSGGTNPDNPTPISDLAGNALRISYKFSFQTIAPPDLPANPFPEYAIWWAATDRVGCIDTVNLVAIGQQALGTQTFPFGIPTNILPQYTDTVASSQNVPGFEPTELSIDGRTGGSCHTWVYVMSPNSGQIVIVHTRFSLPIAIINTPQPGGLSNQTGGGQASNVLMVTNSSANTLTAFDLSNVTPGNQFINGPIFITDVQPTGNTPRAVSISVSPTGTWGRNPGVVGGQIAPMPGPSIPVIMYADFTDGVVNTTRLQQKAPIKQFSLGANSSPGDVALTPCLGNIMFGAISQGGLPNEGKVAYYVSGPGCQTGVQTGAAPDSLVGSLDGFDGPAGLDEVTFVGSPALFVVAESGSQANRVRVLGTETGAGNLPRILNTIKAVGANPTSCAHRGSWQQTPSLIAVAGTNAVPPTCWYGGVEMFIFANACPPFGLWDCSFAAGQPLYICARGAGQVTGVNMVTGNRLTVDPVVKIPGVRIVAGVPTQ